MPISKCRSRSRAVGVLVAFAVFASVAGCAGSAERLPQCKGKSMPINTVRSTVTKASSVSDGHAH
jgi:hypothetical protein